MIITIIILITFAIISIILTIITIDIIMITYFLTLHRLVPISALLYVIFLEYFKCGGSDHNIT